MKKPFPRERLAPCCRQGSGEGKDSEESSTVRPGGISPTCRRYFLSATALADENPHDLHIVLVSLF